MAKRKAANGSGTIRLRHDGRYEGIYTVGHNPDTPAQKALERASITVDGSILQIGRPHLFNHLIKRTLE